MSAGNDLPFFPDVDGLREEIIESNYEVVTRYRCLNKVTTTQTCGNVSANETRCPVCGALRYKKWVKR